MAQFLGALAGWICYACFAAVIVWAVFNLPRIIRSLKRRAQIDRDILDTRLRDMQYQDTIKGRR